MAGKEARQGGRGQYALTPTVTQLCRLLSVWEDSLPRPREETAVEQPADADVLACTTQLQEFSRLVRCPCRSSGVCRLRGVRKSMEEESRAGCKQATTHLPWIGLGAGAYDGGNLIICLSAGRTQHARCFCLIYGGGGRPTISTQRESRRAKSLLHDTFPCIQALQRL